MPRKQKQKQRQSQRQVVNINLGKSGTKQKRKYNRKSPPVIVQQPNYTFTQQPYQQTLTPQVFIPPPAPPNPILNRDLSILKSNPLLSQTSLDPIQFGSSLSNEKTLKPQTSQNNEISGNKPRRVISDREPYKTPSLIESPKIPLRNIGPFITEFQPKPKPSPVMFDMPNPREPKTSQLTNLQMPFLQTPPIEEIQIPSLQRQRENIKPVDYNDEPMPGTSLFDRMNRRSQPESINIPSSIKRGRPRKPKPLPQYKERELMEMEDK